MSAFLHGFYGFASNEQEFFILEASPDTLAHFEGLTTQCRRLSEGSELKTAEHILWSYLPRLDTIAKLSFTHQQAAASVASQSYLLAASLAGHRDDLHARYQLSDQALLYGKLAHDLNLQIAALRQLAVTFDYLGYPRKVLQIYELILPHLHKASPLLRACIYADMSGSYTQLCQQQKAHRFLHMAYDSFPEKTHNEPAYVSTICRYATLILCEGLHHLAFEQPQEAEKSFEKIDGLSPKIPVPEHIRIDVLNCQAETFTALQQLEAACTYLEAAVEASISIGSERRFQEAYVVFQQMQTVWANERRVQSLERVRKGQRSHFPLFCFYWLQKPLSELTQMNVAIIWCSKGLPGQNNPSMPNSLWSLLGHALADLFQR